MMDAWGAFWGATGQTGTVVSGASRLFANAGSQPLVENGGNAEANGLSASISCVSGTQGSPSTSGLASERVRGKPVV